MVSSYDIRSMVTDVKANPSDKTARLVLADAYEELGQMEEAAEQRTLANLDNVDKCKALASFLGLDSPEEDVDTCNYLKGGFEANGEEYCVLTDDEAEKMAKEQVLDSLWACGAEYLADYIPVANRRALVKSINAIQEKCSEDCNEVLSVLLGSNLDDCVDSAISADGRGHFLSSYNGEENEVSYNGISLYIYRVN